MNKIVRNIPDGLEASYADIKLDTISDLANLTGTPPEIVWVSGYHTKGDGSYGSHIFEWDPNSTEAHNGGTIIELGATFPTDWSDQTQLDAWYNYSGGSTGRYKLRYDSAVNVKWFGAHSTKESGYELFDSTYAIQSALNYTGTIYIPEGTYLCNNLSLNSTIIYNITGAGKYKTVLKAISTLTDTDYLIASSSYVNNSSFGGERIIINNLTIDGNNVAQNPCVVYNFFSEMNNCRFMGSATGGYSLVISDYTQNGTLCSTTLVENKVDNCRISGGDGNSFLVTGGQKVTDGMFTNNFVYGGIANFSTLPGWNVSKNHYYSGSVVFNKLSVGTLIQGNYFENAVEVNNFVEAVANMSDNTYNGRLTVSFGNNGSTFILDNPHFRNNGDILHNYFSSTKEIIVNGGDFETATPLHWSNGSSAGKITLNRVWSENSGYLQTGTGNAFSKEYLEDALLTQTNGTWVTPSSTYPTENYTWVKRIGHYNKEGNKITVWFYHEWTSTSVGTGDTQIGILPFASANITDMEYSGIVSNISSTAAVDQFTLYIEPNSTSLKVKKKINGSPTEVMQKDDWEVGSNYIAGQITYFTDL